MTFAVLLLSALLARDAGTSQETASPAVLQQTPPVFATGIEAVYLDVFATHEGNPVLGLRASDFEIHDNGVRQQVSLVQLDRTDLAVVLAFDVSYSLRGEKLRALQAAAREFVNGLGASDEAALVSFCQDIALRVPPTLDRTALAAGLEALEAGGSTSIFDALYLTLRRPWGRGRPVVVLFTDGEDTASWLGPGAARRAVQHSPAVLQVIGTVKPGSGSLDAVQAQQLRNLAESTGGRYWTSDSKTGLQQVFRSVLEAMKTRYLLSYEPVGVERAGRHAVSVKVGKPRVEVRTRSEYWVADER